MGYFTLPAVYLALRTGRKRFSQPVDRRRDCHCRVRRIHLLGTGHSAGWILGFSARRYLHRGHSHPPHAACHVDCLGQFLPPLLQSARHIRKPCPLDGFHCLPESAGYRTRNHPLPEENHRFTHPVIVFFAKRKISEIITNFATN